MAQEVLSHEERKARILILKARRDTLQYMDRQLTPAEHKELRAVEAAIKRLYKEGRQENERRIEQEIRRRETARP